MEEEKPKKFDSSALFGPYKKSSPEEVLSVKDKPEITVDAEVIKEKEIEIEKKKETVSKDIDNDTFSQSRQNRLFFYFIIFSMGIFFLLRLPMARIYYDTVGTILTLAPLLVIFVMMVSAYFSMRKYPDYQKIIRKFYLTFTLKILSVILLFYIFYAPEIFWDVLVPFLRYLQAAVSLEGAFYFLSYLLVFVIVAAVIFVAFRAYQKSRGYYDGSIKQLTRQTLYALFFFFFFVFGASAFAYPEAYRPVLATLGDTIYTLSFGNLQVFKGSDLANYNKIKSLRDFATSLSSSGPPPKS